MSDRTQFAVGTNRIAMPRLTKRALQVVIAILTTAALSFLIVLVNNALTARGGWGQGLDTWLGFIKRSDIIGTMVLTSIVTVISVYWQRGNEKR